VTPLVSFEAELIQYEPVTLQNTVDFVPVTWYHMNMIKQSLLDEIKKRGISARRLSMETGIDRLSLTRFINGSHSIRLEKAGILLEYFGLELRPKRKRSKP
jgi:hypothetical protein